MSIREQVHSALEQSLGEDLSPDSLRSISFRLPPREFVAFQILREEMRLSGHQFAALLVREGMKDARNAYLESLSGDLEQNEASFEHDVLERVAEEYPEYSKRIEQSNQQRLFARR